MNCDAVRSHLLEASPEELRGETDSPLSTHLRSCPRCRAIAEHIDREERRLRLALEAVVPDTPVEEACTRAAWEARFRNRRHVWNGLAPIAAAAGLAGVLLVSTGGPAPGPVADQPTETATALPPVMESAPGQQVAVFETDNPNIVVVWSF
ncbi:MAG: hypothetical protein PVH40_05000 [Gemmatimonadales bacterium]|jgi:anti-sigma factor RsiW